MHIMAYTRPLKQRKLICTQQRICPSWAYQCRRQTKKGEKKENDPYLSGFRELDGTGGRVLV